MLEGTYHKNPVWNDTFCMTLEERNNTRQKPQCCRYKRLEKQMKVLLMTWKRKAESNPRMKSQETAQNELHYLKHNCRNLLVFHFDAKEAHKSIPMHLRINLRITLVCADAVSLIYVCLVFKPGFSLCSPSCIFTFTYSNLPPRKRFFFLAYLLDVNDSISCLHSFDASLFW